jgi:sugar/nucleoside kinase (ribokinase family)
MPGPPRVFVAGPVAWNLMIYLRELPSAGATAFARHHRETVGGTSAGKTMNLCRLGAHVTLRTLVGPDPGAGRVLGVLAAEGATVLAEVDPSGATERHVNLMPADGSRVSIYLSMPSMPAQSEHTDRALSALTAADVAVLDLADSAREFIPAAQQRGVPIWVDLHSYDGSNPFHADFVAAGTVVVFSSERMPDHRTFMTERIAAGAQLVVATHGSQGATALDDAGSWYDVPARPVDHVVDTNGAGDSFFAAFLVARHSGQDVPSSLRAAADWAARCVRSPELAPVL